MFLKLNIINRILKLLNQRKLETLKERWWNQNPMKKVCEKEDDQSDGISIENIGQFLILFKIRNSSNIAELIPQLTDVFFYFMIRLTIDLSTKNNYLFVILLRTLYVYSHVPFTNT